MAFESVPAVPDAEKLLARALRQARSVRIERKKSDTALIFARKRTRERLTAVADALRTALSNIPKQFPSVDGLNEFYRELIATRIDLDAYRQRLGRIQNAATVVGGLRKTYRGRIEAAPTVEAIRTAERAFHGRCASVVKRLDSAFSWLSDVREMFRSLPTVKERFTVCIAGFPNVGKSTLLAALTGAKAEVKDYAFTTKGLNLGYSRLGRTNIQFVDTPGTLNRDRMNPIELQAHLALKYLADSIVYVYDPTDTYPLAEQKALREAMDAYGVPVIEYVSKTDLKPQTSLSKGRATSVEALREAIRERTV